MSRPKSHKARKHAHLRPVSKARSPKGPRESNVNKTTCGRRETRSKTKIDKMVTLLCRPDGAAIGELVRATGWQKHSVRGALSGTIKGKLGHQLSTDKLGGVSRYRIVSRAALAGGTSTEARP